MEIKHTSIHAHMHAHTECTTTEDNLLLSPVHRQSCGMIPLAYHYGCACCVLCCAVCFACAVCCCLYFCVHWCLVGNPSYRSVGPAYALPIYVLVDTSQRVLIPTLDYNCPSFKLSTGPPGNTSNTHSMHTHTYIHAHTLQLTFSSHMSTGIGRKV